jgi:hypothetical protein
VLQRGHTRGHPLSGRRVRYCPRYEPYGITLDGPEQTTVELEDRLLERLVDGQAMREGLQSGGGWTAMLELFVKAAANQE